MAAPIAHIFCALVFLQSPDCPIIDKKAFIVGTSFPDIRYVGHLRREQTHWLDLTIDDIKKEKNPFIAGMKFHSWVDETRERFVEKNNLYDCFTSSAINKTVLKFFEDTQLHEKVDWSEIIPYFDDIQKEEISFGIPTETINHWHSTLQEYFSREPTIEHIKITFEKMIPNGNNKTPLKKLYFWIKKKIKLYFLQKQLNYNFDQLENHDYAKQKIHYFYEHLDIFWKNPSTSSGRS